MSQVEISNNELVTVSRTSYGQMPDDFIEYLNVLVRDIRSSRDYLLAYYLFSEPRQAWNGLNLVKAELVKIRSNGSASLLVSPGRELFEQMVIWETRYLVRTGLTKKYIEDGRESLKDAYIDVRGRFDRLITAFPPDVLQSYLGTFGDDDLLRKSFETQNAILFPLIESRL